MSSASVQHLNILKTLVEIKMSMPHTAVRFSSQSGFIGDRIVSSSDTPTPHLSSMKDTDSYADQLTMQPWVSHFSCLNFFIC